MKKYLMYHLKWQAGFFVVYPTTRFCLSLGLPLWLSIIISSVAGGIVFWPIDKFIFSKKNNNAIG